MATVRTRWFGSTTADVVVAVLPGLGLPPYVTPLAEGLARRGAAVAVLDLPGFGSSAGRVCRPSITSVGACAAEWVDNLERDRQVVVLGHSTGSQAALVTALLVQTRRPDASLVMCGPTFAPGHRDLVRLAAATATAYRRDSIREAVVVPSLLRGNVDVARYIRSGLRDRPEVRIGALTLPVLLTAGKHDTYAPARWLEQLAACATGSPRATTAVLGGSHNNLFTHGDELAATVVDMVACPS